jgi:hypothetical protein
MEIDIAVYERCGREVHEKQRQHDNQRQNAKQMWESIRRDAAAAATASGGADDAPVSVQGES